MKTSQLVILALLSFLFNNRVHADTGWGTNTASASLQIRIVVPSYCYLKIAPENADQTQAIPIDFVCNLRDSMIHLTLSESKGFLSWNKDCSEGRNTLKIPFYGIRYRAYACQLTPTENNLVSVTTL